MKLSDASQSETNLNSTFSAFTNMRITLKQQEINTNLTQSGWEDA
jgi:hypothetical protein